MNVMLIVVCWPFKREATALVCLSFTSIHSRCDGSSDILIPQDGPIQLFLIPASASCDILSVGWCI